jgi:uncharacterized protein YprB with RNaseH-like and TPR domain
MNPQSNLNLFAADFDLVQIGFFDIETGELSPHKPITVINGQQVLNAMMKGIANEALSTKQKTVSQKV